jgi:hypothetical protein
MNADTPQPSERVEATQADRELAMEVAYHLAIHGVTNDDQYRHEAAKKVAQFRLRAVAAALERQHADQRIIEEACSEVDRLRQRLTQAEGDTVRLERKGET